MVPILEKIVHVIADAARSYLKGTPSKLDDLLIPVVDAVEKWVIDNIVPHAAADPRIANLKE